LFVSALLDLPSGAAVVWALAAAGVVAFALEGLRAPRGALR
jgi:hypothetical protein